MFLSYPLNEPGTVRALACSNILDKPCPQQPGTSDWQRQGIYYSLNKLLSYSVNPLHPWRLFLSTNGLQRRGATWSAALFAPLHLLRKHAKHYNSESNCVSNPNTATFTTACSSLHIVTNSVICNDHIPLCTPEACALLGVSKAKGWQDQRFWHLAQTVGKARKSGEYSLVLITKV